MKKSSLYEVGYGKPPEHSRFQKGQSGNPKGRPKGKQNLSTVLNRTLNEKVVVSEHGKRRTITKLEAAFKQLANKAAQGDSRAFQQILSLAPLIGVETPCASQTLDNDDLMVLQQIVQRFESANNASSNSEDTP